MVRRVVMKEEQETERKSSRVDVAQTWIFEIKPKSRRSRGVITSSCLTMIRQRFPEVILSNVGMILYSIRPHSISQLFAIRVMEEETLGIQIKAGPL